MRLLDTSTLRLVSRFDEGIPPYAILSHTWGRDEDEISFQDLQAITSSRLRQKDGLFAHPLTKRAGFAKIRESCRLAKSEGYEFLWVDTCCIDKTSSAELSEAINSMFRWYRAASTCYAFLTDVQSYLAATADVAQAIRECSPLAEQVVGSIRSSRWFTRGWTLQELVAPLDVHFYSRDWILLGTKLGRYSRPGSDAGTDSRFPDLLSELTGIDYAVLTGTELLEDVSIAQRMKWAATRRTTRVEDIAYCLMGIFNVNMPLLYGEGQRAFFRLQEEILKGSNDQSIYAWCCPSYDMLRYQLSGLLSPRPEYFVDSGGIKPVTEDMTGASAPSSMTNAGLHVQFRLHPAEEYAADASYPVSGRVYAILDCLSDATMVTASRARAVRKYRSTAILLTPVGGGQFARLNANILYKITWAEAHDTAAREYVYVKQYSTQDLPEIVYESNPAFVPLYTVVAAEPQASWNPRTGSLRPSGSSRNSIIGGIRYLHPYTGESVDVFVGLSTGHKGTLSWSCWCLQQHVGNPVESASLWDSISQFDDEAPERGPGRASSQHGLQGVLAAVNAVRLRSRTYISLTLSPVFELDAPPVDSTPAAGPFELAADERRPWDMPWGTRVTSLAADFFGRPCGMDTWKTSFGDLGFDLPVAGPPVTIRSRDAALGNLRASGTFEDVLKLASRSGLVLEGEDNSEAGVFDRHFSTLLFRACLKNDAAAVRELLSSPLSTADANARCRVPNDTSGPWERLFRGFRPIHWASALGSTDVLRALLEHVEDAAVAAEAGLTPIHLAAIMGHEDTLDVLLDALDGSLPGNLSFHERLEPPTHLYAAHAPFTSGWRRMLGRIAQAQSRSLEGETTMDDGPRTDPTRNSFRETVLHRAAAMNNVSAAEEIISMREELGIEIDDRDSRMRTPLWHAAAAGSTGVVGCLVRAGADVDARSNLDLTPLLVACREGHLETAKMLLLWGASVAPTHPEFSVCHLAALSGKPELLALLDAYGADLDYHEEGGSGLAPIHVAAASGYLPCVELLCDAGCDESRYAAYSVTNDPREPTGTAVRKYPSPGRMPQELTQRDDVRLRLKYLPSPDSRGALQKRELLAALPFFEDSD